MKREFICKPDLIPEVIDATEVFLRENKGLVVQRRKIESEEDGVKFESGSTVLYAREQKRTTLDLIIFGIEVCFSERTNGLKVEAVSCASEMRQFMGRIVSLVFYLPQPSWFVAAKEKLVCYQVLTFVERKIKEF